MNTAFTAVRYFGAAAHSLDDYEPDDKDIADRAAHLKPLLAKSRADVSELLATTTGTPAWEAFGLALFDHDEFEATRLAKRLLVQAVNEEATRLAEAELWRQTNCHDLALLHRIGARDWQAWMWERNA